VVWLADSEKVLKIRLFVLTEHTNVTDRRTDGHHTTACLTYSITLQKRIQVLLWNFEDRLAVVLIDEVDCHEVRCVVRGSSVCVCVYVLQRATAADATAWQHRRTSTCRQVCSRRDSYCAFLATVSLYLIDMLIVCYYVVSW